MDKLLIICRTGPHTFYLQFSWVYFYATWPKKIHFKANIIYYNAVQRFVEKNKRLGLSPKIKKQYKHNSLYYITFVSKHDVMAFKLTWL